MVILLLQEVRQGNADCEAALTVWVTVFEKVVSGLLVSHDGVGFGNLDELVNCLGIVWVLIWMFFSRQFPVGFLHGSRCSIGCNSKNLMRNESLQWLNIFNNIKALVAEYPKVGND